VDVTLPELRARLDASAPARTLIITPRAGQARWLARLLLDQGPLMGAHFTGFDGLVDGCARAAFGPPARTLELLDAVEAALAPDETFDRISGVKSYQRLVLDLFTELERSTGGVDVEVTARGAASTARDEALFAAYGRFRGLLRRATRGRWWAGDAPRRLETSLSEIPLLRDRVGAMALGWRSERPWETRLLDALDAERWAVPFATALEESPEVRLACASAEVEVAVIARRLREKRQPAVVVVPADEVPWWVTRLGHRDVPVRAWVSRPASATTSARAFQALTQVLTGERVGRRELAAVLLGRAMNPWPTVAAQLQRWQALPAGGLSAGTAQAAWRRLRRGSGSLEQWEQRLEAARLRTTAELRERGRSRELQPSETEAVVERWDIAHRGLAAAIRALGSVEDASDARRLMMSWGYGRGASGSLDPEHVAARTVLETLGLLGELPIRRAAPAVGAALEGAGRGYWVDEGAGAVAVMAYPEVPPLLFDRVVLAGLERVPSPPRPGPLLSDAAREALGFTTAMQQFAEEVELLESLADAPDSTGSWRVRDASGAACPSGPWIAARPGAVSAVGLDALTPGPGVAPSCELERDVLRPAPELARRVAATVSHERPEVGPHTGDLGLAPPALGPTTISALQAYGRNPYGCFLTRTLGLEAAASDAEDALDALEQGTLVHSALERGVSEGLEDGPLDVHLEGSELWQRTRGALDETFREAGEGVLAEPVWRGELARWSREIQAWWNGWVARSRAEIVDDPEAAQEVLMERQERFSSLNYQRARAWRDFVGADEARRRGLVNSGVFGRSWYLTKGAAPWLAGNKDEAEVEKLNRRSARAIEKEEAAVDARVEEVTQAQAVAPGGRILAVELGLGVGGTRVMLGDRSVWLAGRIDRLEWDYSRDRLVVCDYKSGEAPRAPLKAAVASGEHLQLPLYALAVGQLGSDGEVPGVPEDAVPAVSMLRLEYLKRRKGQKHEPVALSPGEVVGVDEVGRPLTAIEAAQRFAGAFVDGIERGWFPCVRRAPRPGDEGALEQVMRAVPGPDERDPGLPGPLSAEGSV